jgi:hypothetical protein
MVCALLFTCEVRDYLHGQLPAVTARPRHRGGVFYRVSIDAFSSTLRLDSPLFVGEVSLA